MRQTPSFQEKLKLVCTLKPDAKLNDHLMHADFKAMLVNVVRSTKKVSWVANKKYKNWKMADFLGLVEESKAFKF